MKAKGARPNFAGYVCQRVLNARPPGNVFRDNLGPGPVYSGPARSGWVPRRDPSGPAGPDVLGVAGPKERETLQRQGNLTCGLRSLGPVILPSSFNRHTSLRPLSLQPYEKTRACALAILESGISWLVCLCFFCFFSFLLFFSSLFFLFFFS